MPRASSARAAPTSLRIQPCSLDRRCAGWAGWARDEPQPPAGATASAATPRSVNGGAGGAASGAASGGPLSDRMNGGGSPPGGGRQSDYDPTHDVVVYQACLLLVLNTQLENKPMHESIVKAAQQLSARTAHGSTGAPPMHEELKALCSIYQQMFEVSSPRADPVTSVRGARTP